MHDKKKSGPPPNALSDSALRQFIKKALDKDWIREGWHSEVERADRCVSHDDILHGLGRLKDWTVLERRYFEEHREVSPYSYTILTEDIDGEELKLAVAPNLRDQTVKVVTKM